MTKTTKYAQMFSVGQHWLRSLIAHIFPRFNKERSLYSSTTYAASVGKPGVKVAVHANAIWEQFCFCHDGDKNWKLERECRLLSKLPAEEDVRLKAGKRYWVVFPL